jgi:hypothetical protein
MKTTTLTYWALALALGLAGLGCGGSDDDTCADGGSCADAGPTTSKDASAPDAGLWGLSSNTNDFEVTAISNVKDDCKADVGSLVGMTLPVNYDTTTHKISIGDDQGTPAQPSLGSGVVTSNKGTLTRENDTGDLPCTWHQKDVSQMTLTANNKFTLAVTEDQSMFASGCLPADVPTGGKCTSTWTWTFEKAAK